MSVNSEVDYTANISFPHKVYFAIRASYAYALVYTLLKFRSLGSKRDVYVKAVPRVGGEGLFTHKAVKKGQVICVVNGPVRFAHFTGDACNLYENWYGFDDGIWIDILYPYVKINHACTPNVGIHDARTFVALRDIEADEELVYDYSTSDDELDWTMPCRCNCQNCTGEIGSVQTLSQERFEMSYPHMPKYFIKLYQKAEASTAQTPAVK